MRKNTFWNLTGKLFVKVIIMDVASFIGAFFLFSFAKGSVMRTLIQALFFLGLTVLLYGPCREAGEQDYNLVQTGHRKFQPMKGLFAGLIVSIPFLILAVLLVLSRLQVIPDNIQNYFRLINAFYFPLNMSVLPVGQGVAAIPWSHIILTAGTTLIIPLLCMFSYLIGAARVTLSERLLYKKAE